MVKKAVLKNLVINYRQYVSFLNQARALWARSWFPEIVLRSVCVCLSVCLAVLLFVCPQARSRGKVANLCSGTKVVNKAGVATLYRLCRRASQWNFRRFTTEKHRSRPRRLLGKAYLVVLKGGVTRTYATEKEGRPRGFVKRIFTK